MRRWPLCVLLSTASAHRLALPASRRVGAAPRAALTTSAEEAEPKAARGGDSFHDGDFLIRNDRNAVDVLKCANKPMLAQGLLEVGDLPHICVAGESNAGKSSLLNHLLRKKNLARASSVAGKTRSVDLMLVNEKVVLADLPGLPSRDHQVEGIWEASWRPLVYQYLRECESLRAMVYVHDVRRRRAIFRRATRRNFVRNPPTHLLPAPQVRWTASAAVREFVRDVRDMGVPVILALTKNDKLRIIHGDKENEQRARLTRKVRQQLGFDGVHVHYSCDSTLPASRRGRRQMLRYFESFVEAESRDEVASQLQAQAEKMQGGGGDGAKAR